MTDLLVAYVVKGSVARKLFESNPEAAKVSGVTTPEKGLGVKLRINNNELKELKDGLVDMLDLLRTNDLDEFVLDPDSIVEAQAHLIRIAAALEIVLSYHEASTDEIE